MTTYPWNDGETSSLIVRSADPAPAGRDSGRPRAAAEPQYVTAYQRLVDNPLDNVLIVGAGTGTDVAIALRKRRQHVDAVEIDPVLLQLGRDRNPDHAYQNPRVTTHVDDGRAFLERTDTSYDLILFALPDSLTLVSGASSLRLRELSVHRGGLHRRPRPSRSGGAFAMYNFYREGWLVDRLAGTLEQAFGHVPCVDANPQYSQQARHGGRPQHVRPGLRRAPGRAPRRRRRRPPTTSRSSTSRTAHSRTLGLYWRTLLLILLASVIGVGRGAAGLGTAMPALSADRSPRMLRYRDLFLLGAAFMLLETKSVTGFALLFGTTWVVNALVFAGVLLAVLAAVEVTRRRATPAAARSCTRSCRGGLALAWVVPSWWLLSPPVGPAAGRDHDRVPADLRGQRHLREAVRRAVSIRLSRSRPTCSARWSAAA